MKIKRKVLIAKTNKMLGDPAIADISTATREEMIKLRTRTKDFLCALNAEIAKPE